MFKFLKNNIFIKLFIRHFIKRELAKYVKLIREVEDLIGDTSYMMGELLTNEYAKCDKCKFITKIDNNIGDILDILNYIRHHMSYKIDMPDPDSVISTYYIEKRMWEDEHNNKRILDISLFTFIQFKSINTIIDSKTNIPKNLVDIGNKLNEMYKSCLYFDEELSSRRVVCNQNCKD